MVVAGSGIIASNVEAAPRRAAKENTEKRAERKKAIHREPALDRGAWQPTVVTDFYWNDESNAWSTEGSTTLYKYDDKGRLVEENYGSSKREYVYNENGQVAEELTYYKDEESSDYILGHKNVYEYDSVVKDFVILEEAYSRYDNDEFVMQWGDKYVVTRDDKGNVTKVENYYRGYYESEYEMYGYFTVEYNAAGVAEVMTLYDVDDDEVEVETQLKDIVWQNTNGQILEMDDDIDEEDYYMGANRIKSAFAVKADGMPDGTTINAEYPDELGSFKYTIKYGEQLISEYSMIFTDEFGSYKLSELTYDMDEEDGNWVIGDEAYGETEEETFDKFGLRLYREVADGSYAYCDKGEVTYDAETGLPVEYISMYKYGDAGDFNYSTKTVYSDYVDISGIEAVEVAGADESPVYFDMRGFRVSGNNLPAGLYIERRGATVRKILVK